MTISRFSLTIIAAVCGLMLAAAPAAALNSVTFVSLQTGNDGNNCLTPGTACATMDAALTKTEAGGEIRCLAGHLDPGFTITKPITIDCDAPSVVIFGFAGMPAITVNVSEA